MSRARLTNAVRGGLLTLLGSVALLWPALLNGGPFWFPDTSNYVRAADAAVVYVTGQRSEWSDRLLALPGEMQATRSPARASNLTPGTLKPTRPVYAGRSIYYGMFLYFPMLLLGAWGAILVQALIAAGVLLFAGRILSRELGLGQSRAPFWTFASLAAATPLPFYTSMLMPDVYSGLLILTLAMAMALFDRIARGEKIVLVALSALFATFHTTHVLIAVAMAVAALLIFGFRRTKPVPVALTIPVLAVGIGSILLFNLAVKMALDESPISPPFLSARLTAAGPGTDYLKRNCTSDEQPFLLCRHRDRLPLESDSLLWSENPRSGLFQLLTREEQIVMAGEDRRFFIATMLDDPVAFAGAATRSALEQLTSFDLDNFNYSQSRVGALFDKYPPKIAQAIQDTRAAKGSFPVDPGVWLSVASTLGAFAILATLALGARRGIFAPLPPPIWDFVALVLLGVLANAAICGALSGPHSRYQMRLIWIVPFAAGLLVTSARRTPPQST